MIVLYESFKKAGFVWIAIVSGMRIGFVGRIWWSFVQSIGVELLGSLCMGVLYLGLSEGVSQDVIVIAIMKSNPSIFSVVFIVIVFYV